LKKVYTKCKKAKNFLPSVYIDLTITKNVLSKHFLEADSRVTSYNDRHRPSGIRQPKANYCISLKAPQSCGTKGRSSVLFTGLEMRRTTTSRKEGPLFCRYSRKNLTCSCEAADIKSEAETRVTSFNSKQLKTKTNPSYYSRILLLLVLQGQAAFRHEHKQSDRDEAAGTLI